MATRDELLKQLIDGKITPEEWRAAVEGEQTEGAAADSAGFVREFGDDRDAPDVMGAISDYQQARELSELKQGATTEEALQASTEAQADIIGRRKRKGDIGLGEAINQAVQKRTLRTVMDRDTFEKRVQEGGDPVAEADQPLTRQDVADLYTGLTRDAPAQMLRNAALPFRLLREAVTGEADPEADPEKAMMETIKPLEPFMTQQVEQQGEMVEVESELGRALRLLGAIPAPLYELAGREAEMAPSPTRSPVAAGLRAAFAPVVIPAQQAGFLQPSDPLLTREERGRDRSTEGEQSFLVDMLQGIEEGDLGFMQLMGRAAQAEGFDPDSPVTKTAKLVGFTGDVALPLERATFAPLTAAAGGVRGARLQAPAGLRGEAVKLGIRSAFGQGDLVDIGDLAAAKVLEDLSKGEAPQVPDRVGQDVSRLLAEFAETNLQEATEAALKGDAVAGTRLADAVREAYKGRARSLMGDSSLVPITDRSVVTPLEAKGIQRRMATLLEDAELKGVKAAEDGTISLNPKQAEGFRKLAHRAGIDVGTVAKVSDEVFNGVIQRNLDEMAGWSARVRGAATRSPGFMAVAEALAKAMDDTGFASNVARRAQTLGSDLFALGLGSKMTRNPFMPTQVRNVLQKHLRAIEGSAESLRHWYTERARAAKAAGEDVGIADLLSEFTGRGLRPVGDTKAARAGDPVAIQNAMTMANDILEAYAPDAARVRRTAGTGLDVQEALDIVDGWLQSPTTYKPPGASVPADAALFGLAVRWNAAGRVRDAMEELAALDIAIPAGSQVAEIATNILKGDDAWVNANGVTVSPHGQVAHSRAVGWLQRMGVISMTSDAAPVVAAIDNRAILRTPDGGEMVVPKFIMDDMKLAMQRAGINPSDVIQGSGVLSDGAARGLNWMTGRYKFMLTAANPTFHLGQVLGSAFQMVNRLGLRGTASALATFATDPGLVGRVVEQLADINGRHFPHQWMPETLNAWKIETPDGRVYTADMIAELARELNLDRSQVRVESGTALLSDLRRMDPTGHRNLLQKAGDAQAGLESYAMEYAHAIEQAFRVSTFVDGLKRGMSPDGAAARARDALYDYGRMTDFERFTLRKAFTFYTFMRSNLEATILGFIEDPSRMGRMSRFVREHREAIHGQAERENIGEWEDNLGKVVLAHTPPGKFSDGQSDYRYSAVNWLMPGGVVPQVEALNMLMAMVGTATGDAGSIRELGGQMTPIAQTAIEEGTGADLKFGRGFSDPSEMTRNRNRVPTLLVNLDGMLGGVLSDALGIQPMRVDESDPANAANPEARFGHKYVATGDPNDRHSGAWRWRQIQRVAPRQLAVIDEVDRALIPGGDQADPTLGGSWAQLARLFFTSSRVRTMDEAMEQGLREREAAISQRTAVEKELAE